MIRLLCGPVLALGLAMLFGCGGGVEGPRMQSRLIADANPDDVIREAEVLLRREFGGIASASERRLESVPRERVSARDSGSARDFVGGSATLRERASFSVSARRNGAMAGLRIVVEREDADRRSASSLRADESRLSDSPSYTPIERDAATSSRQNKVWTYVKRNSALERALLAELSEQFAPGAAPANPPDEPNPEVSDSEPQADLREE